MVTTPYQQLAQRLNALPEGFPDTESGVELLLLAKLFSPEEAALAATLNPTLETVPEISARAGLDAGTTRTLLKAMTRRGLIVAGRVPGGLGFGLLPFVVGIYEFQGATIDTELAQLFEAYYHEAFGRMAAIQPPLHRVIPIGESIHADLDVQGARQSLGRHRLRVPPAEGANRRTMRASAGCVYDSQRGARRLWRSGGNGHRRADCAPTHTRTGVGNATTRRRRGTSAFGQQ